MSIPLDSFLTAASLALPNPQRGAFRWNVSTITGEKSEPIFGTRTHVARGGRLWPMNARGLSPRPGVNATRANQSGRLIAASAFQPLRTQKGRLQGPPFPTLPQENLEETAQRGENAAGPVSRAA